MLQGHVSRPPYTGINDGDIIVRSNTVQLLLDKYASACEEDYKSRPFKEYEAGEPDTKRGILREVLIEIGLEKDVRALETGISFK